VNWIACRGWLLTNAYIFCSQILSLDRWNIQYFHHLQVDILEIFIWWFFGLFNDETEHRLGESSLLIYQWGKSNFTSCSRLVYFLKQLILFHLALYSHCQLYCCSFFLLWKTLLYQNNFCMYEKKWLEFYNGFQISRIMIIKSYVLLWWPTCHGTCMADLLIWPKLKFEMLMYTTSNHVNQDPFCTY